MLLRYVREFMELQKWRAPTIKMLEASAALLQKAGDTIGRQGSKLERERADRDEVQDRLSHLVNQVATHVLRLCDAYRPCQCDHVGRRAKPVRPPRRLQRAAAS